MTQIWYHESLDLHTYGTRKLQLTGEKPQNCKEYQEYKVSVELREMQKERKLQRSQEYKQLQGQKQSLLALSIENPYNEEFKNVMIIDLPIADLAIPSMRIKTASVAKTFALSSEEIKVEINPISIEVDINQKSAIEDPLASFYTKDSSTKVKSIMQKQTGLH
ncbi:hypothetical protein C2G38_2041983 [Gigaspora rosea]|uniref:Uncharacterized protein n=1 Tax=Gigaspora rosea TaxID=44941 RepID=A0A397UU37_9GLOM|nr:hypothetical protein C2G38_2041983 [Gigaspora rosea]